MRLLPLDSERATLEAAGWKGMNLAVEKRDGWPTLVKQRRLTLERESQRRWWQVRQPCHHLAANMPTRTWVINLKSVLGSEPQAAANNWMRV